MQINLALSILLFSGLLFYCSLLLLIVRKKNKKQNKEQSDLNPIQNDHFLKDILNHSREGFLLIDSSYRVLSANQKALSLLGMRETFVLDNTLPNIFNEKDSTLLFQKIQSAILESKPQEFEYFHKRHTNWFNIKIQPIENGLVFFFRKSIYSKLATCISEAELKVFNELTNNEISFSETIAKSLISFQNLFPGMYCSIYTLDEINNELKYFVSGYSELLDVIPNAISLSFIAYEQLENENMVVNSKDIHYEFFNTLVPFEGFSTICTQPYHLDNKFKGVLFFYIDKEIEDFSNFELIQIKVRDFIENTFRFRTNILELEKLSYISENSNKAYVTLNLEEQITWSNKSFKNLFYTQNLLRDSNKITDLFHEENISMDAFVRILNCVNNFSEINLNFEFQTSDNELKHLHIFSKTIFSGDETQLLLEIEDITEQKIKAQLSIEKHEFLNNITNAVPIVLFQCQIDQNGHFHVQFISKELERLEIGYSISEIIEKPELIFEMIHPEDLSAVIEKIDIAQQKLLMWDVEFRIFTKSGTILWIKAIGATEQSDSSKFIWNGYLENITEKKEKLKELKISNDRFIFASKAVNEVIWELDLNINKMTWSDAMNSIFGYSKEFYPEFDTLDNYIHPDDYINCINEFEINLLNPEVELYSSEYRFKNADNKYLNVLDKAFILRNNEGHAKRVIGSIKDITHEKQYEKKKKELIDETQEFERNQFSMELHDGLAQHLVALNLYLSQIEDEVDIKHKEKIEMCKKIVLDSLNQTRTLCYNLSPPELSNGLISGLRSLFDRLNIITPIKFSINYNASMVRQEDFINCDIYNIYRIIQEFTNNSLKYSNCTEINCKIEISKNNKLVLIQIQDDGIGFDMEKVKFGFGIQNMHKRAKLANAKINLKSTIGKGSKLEISVNKEN